MATAFAGNIALPLMIVKMESRMAKTRAQFAHGAPFGGAGNLTTNQAQETIRKTWKAEPPEDEAVLELRAAQMMGEMAHRTGVEVAQLKKTRCGSISREPRRSKM